jgi:hypothetical protein
LGSEHPVVPDFRLRLDPTQDDIKAEANQGMLLHPGDRLLLCSDGLTDLVKEKEILRILLNKKLSDSMDELIETANLHGGRDNITLVGMEVPQKRSKRSRISSSTPQSRPIPWLKISVLTAFLTALFAIIAGVIWYSSQTPRSATPTLSTAEQLLVGTQEEGEASSDIQTALPVQNTPLTNPTEAFNTPIKATYTPWPTNTPRPND